VRPDTDLDFGHPQWPRLWWTAIRCPHTPKVSLIVTLSRRPLLSAAAAVALLLVAGCGSSSGSSAGSVLGSIKVEGTDAEKAPTVTLSTKPLKPKVTESKVLTEGTGAVVGKEDVTMINALVVNATDGKVINDTWAAGASAPVDLGAADVFPAIKSQVPGKKVGSRILIAAPMKDVFGVNGNQAAGLAATDSVVFVVDVKAAATPLKEAKGEAVAPKEGLPTVTVESGKPATVTVPSGATAPTDLVIQPLITGAGAEVADGQTVRVTYTGALWKDGSVFDSSASREPGFFEFPVGQGKVISGWDKALKGQKVGSRLLVVVPPAEGYGEAGSPPKIAGDDTLVFVIDILAVY